MNFSVPIEFRFFFEKNKLGTGFGSGTSNIDVAIIFVRLEQDTYILPILNPLKVVRWPIILVHVGNADIRRTFFTIIPVRALIIMLLFLFIHHSSSAPVDAIQNYLYKS